VRCNNRAFNLARVACKEVLLYAIHRGQKKYGFKLYALCIMSNHVHYLLQPAAAEDLPKIMHWLNWYTAMCFNRMLKRTGHFWEQRYYSDGFSPSDRERALNTLRYIHGNPKAAGIGGFFYDFSNYGSYVRLTDDGLTGWHPAFLSLGQSLDDCAKKYKKFAKRYRTRPKPERRNSCWGDKLLAGLNILPKSHRKVSPGQLSLPLGRDYLPDIDSVAANPEINSVARGFRSANRRPISVGELSP